jgi:hypothetical protein
MNRHGHPHPDTADAVTLKIDAIADATSETPPPATVSRVA